MNLLVLILPLLSGLTAQILKFFIRANGQELKLKNITAYSGMPSGHSAMIMSLVAIIGLEEGLSSPLFAVAVVLAVIIIRDALGLRRYLGQHGKILNYLVKDLKNDDLLEHHYPHLLEKIGHTPAQVAVGSLIGIMISLIGFLLF